MVFIRSNPIYFNKITLFALIGWLSLPVYAENSLLGVQRSFRQVVITGFTRARRSMVLATEVAGKVEQVYVDIGDVVPNHGKVTCLDDTFVKLEVDSIENEIAQHRINSDYFKKQVLRYQTLIAKNSAAIYKLDDFKRQQQSSERMAEVKRIKKQGFIEKQKRHCINSPSGWLLVERYVERGQWLDIGAAIAKVGDYSSLLVPIMLSISEYKVLINNSHNFNVRLSEYDLQVPAKIEYISPAFDEKTRKIKVDLLVKQNLPLNIGGLRVELTLNIPESDRTFLISEKAIDKRFEETWLERKNGQPLRVEWLGSSKNGVARIQSNEIKITDMFKTFHP